MSTAIDYAPPQKWHQRKRFRRILTAFLILLTLALAAYFLGPPIYDKCRMLYWQRQCMNHVDPPGLKTFAVAWSSVSTTTPEFESFAQLADLPELRRRPVPGFPPYYRPAQSFAYLRARQSPAGRRLVYAYFDEFSEIYGTGRPEWGQPGIYLRPLVIFVIQPGTLFSPPKIVSSSIFNFNTSEIRRLANYRIDSDPSDESAFVLTTVYVNQPSGTNLTSFCTFHIDAGDKAQSDTPLIDTTFH